MADTKPTTNEEEEHESICDFCSRVVIEDEIYNCQKCGRDCMCDQCFMEHREECKDG